MRKAFFATFVFLCASFLCASVHSAAAQDERAVEGVVTDEATGAPLPGANVLVKGTSAGTATNAEGEYTLSVPVGSDSLTFSFVGYRAQTVAIRGRSEVNVQLTPAATQLDDVVKIGYGTESRRRLSTAVTSVSSEQIENVPVAGVDARLQGQAAGVQVTQNSGLPGTGISVRVRGTASINASSQPLYVIDGVPMHNRDFSQLDFGGQDISAVTGISPQQIASVDVLKGPTASAIYGSRAANGVVVITTKDGNYGARPTVTFDSYAGVQEVANMLDLLEPQEYVDYRNEAIANDRGESYSDDFGFVDDGVDNFTEYPTANTNWQEEVFRPAPVQSYELAVSGGGDRVRYHVSGEYFDQQGIVLGARYDRANVRVNLGFDASERLNVSTKIALSRESNHRIVNDNTVVGVLTNAIANPPMFPVRGEDGEYTSPDDGLEYANAVAIGKLNDAEALTLRALGNVKADYQITDALTLTARGGLDVLNLREDEYESGRVEGTYAASVDGIAKRAYTTASRYLAEGFLTYETVFGEDHDLSVVGGSSVEVNDTEDNFVRGESFGNEQFRNVGNTSNIVAGDGSLGEYNLVSFFSRASYSFDERYLLSASLRADGSSRFAANTKFGLFPSASVGWRIDQEAFMEDAEAVSNLKLRASYGLSGNDDVGNYGWQGTWESVNYNQTPGLAPGSIRNPDYSWETVRQFDIGLEAGLFEDRLSLAADYYRKKTLDMLLFKPLSYVSGFSGLNTNVGNMVNQGIELTLDTRNVVPDTEGGFAWNSSLNVSANRNEVTDLKATEAFTVGDFRQVNRVEEGEPLGAFYMIEFEGVDPETGDAIFDDVNEDGEITDADRQIVGSPHPDFTGGFSNELRWKGFDLSAMLYFNYGNEVFHASRVFTDDGGYYGDNKLAHVLDRWQEPGDQTNVPRASYDATSGARRISSRYVEDGSYLRIKNVTLGYTLPSSLIGDVGIQSARVYASGQNLYTFTEYMGLDPAVNYAGSNANVTLGTSFYTVPIPRTFQVGVSLKF